MWKPGRKFPGMSGLPPWASRQGPSGWSAVPTHTSLPTETYMKSLPFGARTTDGAQTIAPVDVALVQASLVGQLSARNVHCLKSVDSQQPSVRPPHGSIVAYTKNLPSCCRSEASA